MADVETVVKNIMNRINEEHQKNPLDSYTWAALVDLLAQEKKYCKFGSLEFLFYSTALEWATEKHAKAIKEENL